MRLHRLLLHHTDRRRIRRPRVQGRRCPPWRSQRSRQQESGHIRPTGIPKRFCGLFLQVLASYQRYVEKRLFIRRHSDVVDTHVALGASDGQLVVDPLEATSTTAATTTTTTPVIPTAASTSHVPLAKNNPQPPSIPVRPSPAAITNGAPDPSPGDIPEAEALPDEERTPEGRGDNDNDEEGGGDSDNDEEEDDTLPSGLNDAILRRLAKFSGPTYIAEVRRLKSLDELELTREGNIATRDELFQELHLDKGLFGMASPPRSSAAAGTNGSHTPSSEPELTAQDDDAELSLSTTDAEADLTGCPDWMTVQYRSLRGEPFDPQDVPTWQRALNTWVLLERSLGFQKTVRRTRCPSTPVFLTYIT